MGQTFKAIGADGEYEIAQAGYHPQAKSIYGYQDQHEKFWFYVDLLDTEKYTLAVHHATTERLAGYLPRLSSVHRKAIVEENIRRYLQTIDVVGSPIPSAELAPIVLFRWHLSD